MVTKVITEISGVEPLMEPLTVHEDTKDFLEDHPGSEDVLSELVALDGRERTWAFDQADVDSGRFGELVSRGIVESAGDEYRITYREAVQTALRDESFDPEQSDSNPTFSTPSVSINYGAVGGLLFALGVVVIGRAWTYESVFRQGHVISPANDPYFYRYWQAKLLEISTGVTDTSVVSSLPGGARSRPYTHVVNWWLTELFGGTQAAADLVAAWLPVVGTAALGVVLYATVITLTDDVRIGIVAVTLLGLMPVHAVYTSLGFLEHRVHQYFWLGVMVFTLTWLAKNSIRHRGPAGEIGAIDEPLTSLITWGVAALLAVSVAVSPYPWAGSALIFGPVAVYLLIRVHVDLRRGVSPALANLPTTVAVTAGGLVALYPHLRWGWHESTAFLAYTPLLVAIGAVVIVSAGEVWRRLGLRTSRLVGIETVAATGIIGVFILFRPDQWGVIRGRIDALLFRGGIRETVSLFSVDSYVFIEPLIQLGIPFYLAIVTLGYISWTLARQYRPDWLVLVVFAWYFLLLATIQVRFAGQLALFVSIFAAVSIVYLLATVDLVRRPEIFSAGSGNLESAEPSPHFSGEPAAGQTTGDISRFRANPQLLIYVVGITALLLSANIIYTPGLMQTTMDSDGKVEAMTEIQRHAEATDRNYPENFVLSRWGQNRMYNYFVSGESRSYGFARSNFESFISDPDPDEQYQQLGDRTGYVVVTRFGVEAPAGTTQAKLAQDLGAGDDPTAHYKLLYAGDGVRAFALVEGAVITVTNVSADRVTASTDVQTAGQRFEYSRSVTPDENGTARIRVAYSGEYQVGNRTISVSDSAVHDGKKVTARTIESVHPRGEQPESDQPYATSATTG